MGHIRPFSDSLGYQNIENILLRLSTYKKLHVGMMDWWIKI